MSDFFDDVIEIPSTSLDADESTGVRLDDSWATSTFFINSRDLEDHRLANDNRSKSSADTKFTDTSVGGNIGINSRPQFTRYADPRVRGTAADRNSMHTRWDDSSANLGMGRYYSENIDDPSQVIYMQFGNVSFNSFTGFLRNFSDSGLLYFVTTGKIKSSLYTIADTITSGMMFFVNAPLAIFMNVIKYSVNHYVNNNSRFYSLKEAMGSYWGTVNMIVNTIAINKGLYTNTLRLGTRDDENAATNTILNGEELKALGEAIPNMFDENLGIDVPKIVARAQIASNKRLKKAIGMLEANTEAAYADYIESLYAAETVDVHPKGRNFNEYLKSYANYEFNKVDQVTTPPLFSETSNSSDKTLEELKARHATVSDYMTAEWQHGSLFASLRVSGPNQHTESFTSSVKESELANKFNSGSSAARDARFTFAGGNLGDGMVFDTIEKGLSGAHSILTGALNGATFGISGAIGTVLMGAKMDVPKHWDGSTAELPTATYDLELRAPYGHVVSQIQNIWIPLAMLMAGALPRQTGKQSHTSPYICALYDRGRLQTRLGMITSLTINRGTTNLPYDLNGNVLGLDVSFTVTDLSNIMAMPISTGQGFNGSGIESDSKYYNNEKASDDDNVLSDYLSILGGLGLNEQIYYDNNRARKIAQKYRSVEAYFSAASNAAAARTVLNSGFYSWATLKAGYIAELMSNKRADVQTQ